jgi:Fibronectin type III domain
MYYHRCSTVIFLHVSFVLVPGAPPTEVKANKDAENSISVCWLPPEEADRNGMLLGCIVRYVAKSQTSLNSVAVNVTNPGDVCAKVTDLEAGEVYQLSVSCYNSAGMGPFSDVIEVNIPEGVPLLPASNVTAVAVSSTHVEVTFIPPAHSARRSTLRYRLLARKLSSKPVELVSSSAESTDAVDRTSSVRKRSVADSDGLIEITGSLVGKNMEKVRVGGLRKYTTYEISVICFTDAGEGPPSDTIIVQTMEDGNYKSFFIIHSSVHQFSVNQ